MADHVTEVKGEMGAVRIANEVVAIVASLAAIEVPGLSGMSGGVVGGIAERLGRKNLSKGVKVEVGEREAAIDLYVIVDFGVRIPDVATQVQTSVKRAVETMTGLKVVEVNVHVQGVAFAKEEEPEEVETRVR
ncbi:MAG: Asp23/Gls24 family envelope stress response protein [Bacillota bacterium]|jgi:uncharacterized alkaline shock family protein YloU